MCESRRLTMLWASTSCYRDRFTFFFLSKLVFPGSMHLKDTGSNSGAYNRNWNISIFCDIIPCIEFIVSRRFGGAFRLTSNGLHGVTPKKLELLMPSEPEIPRSVNRLVRSCFELVFWSVWGGSESLGIFVSSS
jgi:hypothetical protein